MNTTKKTGWLGAGLALALVCGLAGRAQAYSATAYLNIDVQIVANLSVSVNNAASSTETVTWTVGGTQALVQTATNTVLNNSGAQTEKWALSTNGTSMSQGSGGSWSLGTSTTSVGADTFALQAVFGSSQTASCLANNAATWNNGVQAPLMTVVPTTYTNSVFAASALNTDGEYQPDTAAGRIVAGHQRALCWRIIAPDSTSTLDTQNVQVIITAQNP